MSRLKGLHYFMIIVMVIGFIFLPQSGMVLADENEYSQNEWEDVEFLPPVRGIVLRIISESEDRLETSGDDFLMQYQVVEIKILEGSHKDKVIIVENFIDAYNMVVDKGYRVLLYIEEDQSGNLSSAFILEIIRDRYLLYLVIAFMALLILLGGWKGLKVIMTLVLTAFAVLKVLIPLVMRGYPPVLISVSICIAIIFLTLVIINGWNKKTVAAIIGTTGGILLAGGLSLLVGSSAKLTGMGNEYAQMLMYIPQNIDFDFRGLLFSGIILGSMGAVMDVSMSVASAMNEIETIKPEISAKELVKSGMNVGRDVMGTMSNTLILAYAGGSLHLMLLFTAYEVPFVEIINKDIIASEVLRAIAGSIGLLFVIPLTAFVAGMVLKRKTENNK